MINKEQDIEATTELVEDEFLEEEDIIQSELRKRMVATLRNKVYIFFLALFLFMFWPTFLSPIEKIRGEGAFKMFTANPIEGMHRNRGEGGLLEDIEKQELDTEAIQEKIEKTIIEKEVISHLIDEKKQNAIINCLNYDICQNMSDALKEELDFLRIFLIVGGLSDEKMDFDQKEVLRNLSEYMLSGPKGEVYGNIMKLTFLGVSEVSKDYKLQRLGLSMEIEFTDKEGLFEFLANMENKIYMEVPVMYVIDSMSYDVVNYDNPQIVGIKASAYFFTGEIEEVKDDIE